jgi:hypothetical protein
MGTFERANKIENSEEKKLKETEMVFNFYHYNIAKVFRNFKNEKF